jgi:uncharacterized protein (TIGR02145 family)
MKKTILFLMIITSLFSCKKDEVKKPPIKKIEMGETGTFTDTRDGKIYKTITIGNQTWMAENLAYLPEISYNYYVYEYKGENKNEAKAATTNYKTYGVLYNYAAASDQNNWPTGWHLPEISEFEELKEYLGNDPGSKLKTDFETLKKHLLNSTYPDYNLKNPIRTDYHELKKYFQDTNKPKSELIKHVISKNASNNASGFSALLGGYRVYEMFIDLGERTYFWAFKENADSNSAPCYILDIYSSEIYDEFYSKEDNRSMSVRLIKDKE